METIVVERKYCPDCHCQVQAEKIVDSDEGLIWQCLECGAILEWIEE